MIDAREFGAIGDGATDSTAAIQSCLKPGETTYLPAGHYRVSQLVIPPACMLRGDGPNQTWIKPLTDSARPLLISGSADGKLNAQKIKLRDLAVSGDHMQLPGLIEFGFGGAPWGSQPHIRDCQIRDCPGFGLRLNQNVSYLQDCFIRQCDVGLDVRGNGLRLDRVEFMQCRANYIWCQAVLNDVHFEGMRGEVAINVYRKTVFRSPSFSLHKDMDVLVEFEQDNIAIHDPFIWTKPGVRYKRLSGRQHGS